MGLSNFPSAAEGLLAALVVNTVVSVALLKNMFRSLLQVVGATCSYSSSPDMTMTMTMNMGAGPDEEDEDEDEESCRRRRRRRGRVVSITQYKCIMGRSSGTRWGTGECCVCLSGFQGSEEVSELSCQHFFHKACLDRWFLDRHTTCPLCRSTS